MNQYLKGGRENKIYKKDNCIYRPAEKWSQNIHSYLRYLHDVGFNKVPYPFAITSDGFEVLSYIEGKVYHQTLPEFVKADETLIAVAMMLKEFHDYGTAYINKLDGTEEWMLCTRKPIETMCHGDFAPYNIVFDKKKVAGMIDFDTLHPGPRMWDIAYALYRWTPLMDPNNRENFGNEHDKQRRLKLFCDSYGLIDIKENEIIGWVIKRLEYLIEYMNQEAEKGNETCIKNIKDGHLDSYLSDINYLRNCKM